MDQVNGQHYGVKHFLAVTRESIALTIARRLALPTEQIRELAQLGSIYHNEFRCTDPTQFVDTHDKLRVHTTPRRFSTQSIDEKIIIFQNDEFLVVNKPAGVPVHATVDNLRENVLFVLSSLLGTKLKITNRLDIATQGLLVLAKTEKFQRQYNQYLATSQVKKFYRARVHGSPATGTLVHYMEPSPRAPKTVSEIAHEGWAKCILKILESKIVGQNISEVIIDLETGRTHQIRAQMAAVGHTIVGDTLYGSPVSREDGGIALQCHRLEFPENFKFELLPSLD